MSFFQLLTFSHIISCVVQRCERKEIQKREEEEDEEVYQSINPKPIRSYPSIWINLWRMCHNGCDDTKLASKEQHITSIMGNLRRYGTVMVPDVSNWSQLPWCLPLQCNACNAMQSMHWTLAIHCLTVQYYTSKLTWITNPSILITFRKTNILKRIYQDNSNTTV